MKIVKNIFAFALIAALSATMINCQVNSVSANDIKSWKFDFGMASDTEDGYIAVTPDTYFYSEDSNGYGFIGTNENDYKLSNRFDGFEQQEGQITELAVGGGTGLYDGIGSVGEDSFGNVGDEYYPVRFAVKAEDEAYYKIKATVTTLDPNEDACATLYTERKHPLYTDKTIAAGESVTTEFTIRVTPVYYQKSDPKGLIADQMINVCVMGKNTALAALEIEQIDTATTLWVLGDSTVTDGPATLPFFRLQNYTGVGTGLTKYLSSDIAVVNEGEGGLASVDNLHFNVVKDRIKAGDYMYVEYGHNENSTEGYMENLDKYYDVCHSVGAKLLVVSPIERINTWNSETNRYDYSQRRYADAGEQYVAEKIAAGANDIAYVDLNKYSLDFYNNVVESHNNNADSIKYYFRTAKNGGTDRTHPNDAGAENLADCFIRAAQAVTDETQADVLKELLTNLRDEEPTLVSEEIIESGLGGEAWPLYNPPVKYEYPIVIKDVKLDENNQFTTLTAYVQSTFESYAVGILEILDDNGDIISKHKTVNHIDNTGGTGTSVLSFCQIDDEGNQIGDSGIFLDDNQKYIAYMWPIDMQTKEPLTEEEGGKLYSSVYTPTDIDEYLLPGENGNIETFDYYQQESLIGTGDYVFGGSSGSSFSLGKDENGVTYSDIINYGTDNSWYLMRPLENLSDGIGTTGRYMIDLDMIYTSGEGLTFSFVQNTTPSKSPFISGSRLDAFRVGSGGSISVNNNVIGSVSGSSWTNVKYIIDMDAGTAEVSVAGGTPVTINIPEYAVFDEIDMQPLNHFVIIGDRSTACSIKISNMTVAKLKGTDVETTLCVSTQDFDNDNTDDNFKITVDSDKEYSNAMMIVASYNENKLLSGVSITDISISAGSQIIPVDAEDGDKIMLWNKDDQKPIIDAMEADIPEDTEGNQEKGTVFIGNEGITKVTVPQSSLINAYAIPDDGYTFVEWVDSDGNVFSKEPEVLIRLYKDLSLTAVFANQGTVNDIVDYDIITDKSLIRANNGSSVKLSVVSAVDANGLTAIFAPDDVTWLCDEKGVTVENGEVTLSDEFDIGDNTTKDFTVKSVLNGIENSYTLTAYSYLFYENVNKGIMSTNWTGDLSKISDRDCIVMPVGGETSVLTLPEGVDISNGVTISYTAAWSGKDCGQPRYIEVYDSMGNKVINDVIGYSWSSFIVGGDIAKSSIDNGFTFSTGITEDAWSDKVIITIGTDGTGTVSFNGEEADITVNNNASDIASIKFISGNGAPDYTERALGITEITIR